MHMDPEQIIEKTDRPDIQEPVVSPEQLKELHTTDDSILLRTGCEKERCCDSLSIQAEIDAAKTRNLVLLDDFTKYRGEVKKLIEIKDTEITQLNAVVSGANKDSGALLTTVKDLTDKLIVSETKQSELHNSVAALRDELDMEKSKSSQLSSQCISLQFKLAQEKASKSIKSTAASISSSIKSLSQDLFIKKSDPVILNEGYSTFVKKYEGDMKHIDSLVKDIEGSYQKTVNEWISSEEVHRKRLADLLEENKELRREKNELEQSLRSTIQSLETNNQDLSSQLIQARIMYKVSDQEENNLLVSKLENEVKEQVKNHIAAVETFESNLCQVTSERSSLQEQVNYLRGLCKRYEGQLMTLEDVDVTKIADEEKKRVTMRLSQWIEDSRQYDFPGYNLDDDYIPQMINMWKTDDSIRITALQWMNAYMKKTVDDQISELVLQSMPLEVYEVFTQVLVPILQSRANSTVKVSQRQTLIYDMKITTGIVDENVETPLTMDWSPMTPAIEEDNGITPTTETKAKKSRKASNVLCIEKRWLWND